MAAFARNDSSAAFRLRRQGAKLWPTQPIRRDVCEELHLRAVQLIEKNPNDAGALHQLILCKAVRKDCNAKELLHMAKKCVYLEPEVAHHFYLLGSMYSRTRSYVDALKCMDRALELDKHPGWLFDRATALRVLDRDDKREVIKAYEDYIESNERDAWQIPDAFYWLGLMHLLTRNKSKAEECLMKGLEAESPLIRLPCFGPVDHDECSAKEDLLMHFQRKETVRARGLTDSLGRYHLGSEVTCGFCGKTADKMSQCGGCKKVNYCDRACQRGHWKSHKKNCAN